MNAANQTSIQIGPNKIISSNSTKYLGIFIDSDLKWHNHIKHILNKFAISARILYTVGIILINLHSLKFTTALYILTLTPLKLQNHWPYDKFCLCK